MHQALTTQMCQPKVKRYNNHFCITNKCEKPILKAFHHQEVFMKTFNQGLQEEERNLAKSLNCIICNESLYKEAFFVNFYNIVYFHYRVQAKSLIPLIFSMKTRLFASSTTQKASSTRQKA